MRISTVDEKKSHVFYACISLGTNRPRKSEHSYHLQTFFSSYLTTIYWTPSTLSFPNAASATEHNAPVAASNDQLLSRGSWLAMSLGMSATDNFFHKGIP